MKQQTAEDINLLTFPQRLYLLLEIETDGFIRWADHGCCFQIVDHRKFVKFIIPKYFNQSKFTSFQRQLNIYGFRKLLRGDDRGSYFHPQFQMHHRELLLEMKRLPLRGSLQSYEEFLKVPKTKYPKAKVHGTKKKTGSTARKASLPEVTVPSNVDLISRIESANPLPITQLEINPLPAEKSFFWEQEDDIDTIDILSIFEEDLLESEDIEEPSSDSSISRDNLLVPLMDDLSKTNILYTKTTPRIVPIQILSRAPAFPSSAAHMNVMHYPPTYPYTANNACPAVSSDKVAPFSYLATAPTMWAVPRVVSPVSAMIPPAQVNPNFSQEAYSGTFVKMANPAMYVIPTQGKPQQVSQSNYGVFNGYPKALMGGDSIPPFPSYDYNNVPYFEEELI